jgi:hypothetical protein
MKNNYQNIQWVVQKNLHADAASDELRTACEKLRVDFVPVEIIPFSREFPQFPRTKRSIVYGSTTFGENVFSDPALREGLFFDPQQFSMENYFSQWGKHMLNYGAQITTFEKLAQEKMDPEKLVFIRPDADSKSFAGEVVKFSGVLEWFENLQKVDNSNLTTSTKIIVSEPFNLKYEWRLWIVNGKVVAASKYRENFRLKKEEGCPEEVKNFAEERCREYQPHAVFVMDICLCGNEYFIIECNCMNSAGFYHADVFSIVQSVSDYFVKNV